MAKTTPLTEVTASIRQLGKDLRGTEGRLGKKIGGLENKMDSLEDRLTKKIDGLDDRLTKKIDTNTDEIGEMIGGLATKIDAINYGPKIKELEDDIRRIKKELMIA